MSSVTLKCVSKELQRAYKVRALMATMNFKQMSVNRKSEFAISLLSNLT